MDVSTVLVVTHCCTCIEKLLKRQEEMEANFYMYLKAGKSSANKRRKANECNTEHAKWISL